jgi:hypothetical protein
MHDDNAAGGARDGEARAKRPYEAPRIQSEAIFETTALACGKISAASRNCRLHSQNS